MPEYDNKNSGVLFKNTRKTEDKHPDYAGTYTDGDGNEYFLDAWIRESDKGKYMKLRTKLKNVKQPEPEQSSDGTPF